MSPQNRVEVVCLGETMAQLRPSTGEVEHAVEFRLGHGGAESNVAIGLSRLGSRAAWVSRLGDDPLGRRIAGAVAGEGVDVSAVAVDTSRQTGLFIKDVTGGERPVAYYRSESAASVLDASDLHRGLEMTPTLLHATGVTAALSTSARSMMLQAPQRCRSQGTLFSFDVNFRQNLWLSHGAAADTLARIAAEADLLFVGLDEAHALWGSSTAREIRERFSAPQVVVVKDGANAVTVFVGVRQVSVPTPGRTVVEPVGAGDALAAGFLHGFLHRWPVQEAVSLGQDMAGISLSSRSDVGDRQDVADLASRSATGLRNAAADHIETGDSHG